MVRPSTGPAQGLIASFVRLPQWRRSAHLASHSPRAAPTTTAARARPMGCPVSGHLPFELVLLGPRDRPGLPGHLQLLFLFFRLA